MRVDPAELDLCLQKWNEQYGSVDESLAIDVRLDLKLS